MADYPAPGEPEDSYSYYMPPVAKRCFVDPIKPNAILSQAHHPIMFSSPAIRALRGKKYKHM
jgi:hypothetical protein